MIKEYLALKWGTLKRWNLGDNKKALSLLERYSEIGMSASAMAQNDTEEQKNIICELIDTMNIDTVHLDWDGIDVSKEVAKKYVREYGK